MKKYILQLLIILLCLCGCNKNNVEFNVQEMANDLLSNVEFNDQLVSVNVNSVYDIDNALESVVYFGSGATSEEIAIFKFANSDDANKALEIINNHIMIQKRGFENYLPNEVEKLENAIIRKEGNYIILCISNDSVKALTIIKKYI